MKREKIIEGLKDGIADHRLDPREDVYIYITEAITELEGTRSIEEVRVRREENDYGLTQCVMHGAVGQATELDSAVKEDDWFLKKEE